MTIGYSFIGTIGGYFINILVNIVGYYINGHWWLFYRWQLMVIILMAIGGYFIGGD